MEENNILENVQEAVVESTDAAEIVKEKAEEALNYVCEMDTSTIVKIGVVGGLVGAAAGTFVFKPIRDKIVLIPDRIRQFRENQAKKLEDQKAAARDAEIARLQKKLEAVEALKEKKD